MRSAWAILLVVAMASADAAERVLKIGGHRLQVEVASSSAERQRGLMERTTLAAGHGMLFVFPRAQRQCLWMKNTPLPLSAVFLGDDGRVLNVVDLQPHDLRLKCSEGPARFAIEANQGWFAARGVLPGAAVLGLPQVD